MSKYIAVITTFIFITVTTPVFAQDALVTPKPDEILIGPILVTDNIEGIPIAVRTSSFVTVITNNDSINLRLRAIIDLGELQRKIGSLIDTIPLPTDNCRQFDIDNIVAKIWGKELTINDSTAKITLKGYIDVWTCAKNPIPCSRIEFRGMVPRVHLYDCNSPIKNHNLRQPFTAVLPFSLFLPDSKTVAVNIGDPQVDLGGQLGGVTQGILTIAGFNINGRVKSSLDKSISPSILQQSIPEEYLKLNPNITSANLFDNNGSLAAELVMEASATSATLTQLLQALVSSKIGSGAN